MRGSQGVNKENTSSTLESSPIPVQDVDEDLEVLCARTEALHVHGYHTVAGKLAMKLAEKILSDGSNLNISSHSGGTRNSNRGPGSGSFTSTILIKAAFLCNVLAEDLHCHHLAFRVGMLGLEMPRQPARSKALEVIIRMSRLLFLTLCDSFVIVCIHPLTLLVQRARTGLLTLLIVQKNLRGREWAAVDRLLCSTLLTTDLYMYMYGKAYMSVISE